MARWWNNAWCVGLTWFGICICLFLTGINAQNTQNIYKSNCSRKQILLECPDFHKIAIKRLFYGTKIDPRCGIADSPRTGQSNCCSPSHNDCLVVEDTRYPFLNMLCSGRRGCDIQAKSIMSGSSCYDQRYRNVTDYMSVIHDCIPDNDIVTLCSNDHKRGKLLYLANKNYPHPIAKGNQQCQCLIKTKNQVGLDLHALDVIISRSDEGSECYQDIEIRDEDGHRKEITCGHPGLYAFRNIYNQDVRSVTFTLNSRAPKAQGYIWLQAKAKNNSDFVEMYCGDAMRRYLGLPVVEEAESRTIDTNDPNKKPGTVNDEGAGGTANSTRQNTPKVVSDIVALIVGVSVAMAIIIIIGLIGIIILCVRRSREKRPVRHEPPAFPSPILTNTKGTNHSSNTYCHYDYDEDKYCSIKRSPMRLTNFTDLNYATPNRKLREAFTQGLASSESINKDENDALPGYYNYMEQVTAKQNEPLISKRMSDIEVSDEDEIIMPKSEYIAIGKAIPPQTVNRDVQDHLGSLPPKKKMKNKTVTFSPVAMVTPLPTGSDEIEPAETITDDPKMNFLEMYSKTMPNRSPDKVKKVIVNQVTQDDMCLPVYHIQGGENVTEEDLWKVFNISLNDKVPTKQKPPISPKPALKQVYVDKQPEIQEPEDPDYDENPYDNVPYINVGSLRRNNTPETTSNDIYKEILKKNHREPAMASIPEGF